MTSRYVTDVNFKAPVLPYAGPEYDQLYSDEYDSALRIYFNQLDEAVTVSMAQEYSQSVAWFMS